MVCNPHPFPLLLGQLSTSSLCFFLFNHSSFFKFFYNDTAPTPLPLSSSYIPVIPCPCHLVTRKFYCHCFALFVLSVQKKMNHALSSLDTIILSIIDYLQYANSLCFFTFCCLIPQRQSALQYVLSLTLSLFPYSFHKSVIQVGPGLRLLDTNLVFSYALRLVIFAHGFCTSRHWQYVLKTWR